MSSGGASESAPWGYIAAINAATDTRTFRATNTTPTSATTAPPTRWPGKVDGQEEVGGGWRNFYFLFSGEKKWPKKEVCRQKWKASKSAKLFRGGGFDIILLGCWVEGGACGGGWWVVGGDGLPLPGCSPRGSGFMLGPRAAQRSGALGSVGRASNAYTRTIAFIWPERWPVTAAGLRPNVQRSAPPKNNCGWPATKQSESCSRRPGRKKSASERGRERKAKLKAHKKWKKWSKRTNGKT